MEEDTLDISDSSAEGKITIEVKRTLISIRRWAIFTAIVGFLLSVCGLFYMAFVYIEEGNRSYRSDDFVIGMLVFGALTIFIFLVAKFLLDYARNLNKSFKQNSDIHLAKAFRGARNAILMIAILGVVLLSLAILGIILIIVLSNFL